MSSLWVVISTVGAFFAPEWRDPQLLRAANFLAAAENLQVSPLRLRKKREGSGRDDSVDGPKRS
ncbi:MAG: hypothetical protein ABI147_02445 [Acidobacteriaceae bacterium]